MFLTAPEPTPYDLRWTMFGIPVRVHPMFWLVSVILGWNTLEAGFQFLLLWVLCVFVSILVHEMGHVLAGRLFGTNGEIILYSFGGLAVGASGLTNRWQRVFVYFAGPLAGFLLLGLVLIPFFVGDRESFPPLAWVTIRFLIWINLFWGLLNLLPIWPLDGGQISREVLGWLAPRRGVRASLGIPFTIAALLAINAIAASNGHPLIPYLEFMDGMYMALFFGLLALGSYQAMQTYQVDRPWERHDDEWRR